MDTANTNLNFFKDHHRKTANKRKSMVHKKSWQSRQDTAGAWSHKVQYANVVKRDSKAKKRGNADTIQTDSIQQRPNDSWLYLSAIDNQILTKEQQALIKLMASKPYACPSNRGLSKYQALAKMDECAKIRELRLTEFDVGLVCTWACRRYSSSLADWTAYKIDKETRKHTHTHACTHTHTHTHTHTPKQSNMCAQRISLVPAHGVCTLSWWWWWGWWRIFFPPGHKNDSRQE